MSIIIKYIFICMMLLPCQQLFAQQAIKGRVIDAGTQEPIAGAVISCGKAGCNCGCVTNSHGFFEMNCDCGEHTISSVGYTPKSLSQIADQAVILLAPSTSVLHEVVLTASRGEGRKRSEAPVAIATISNKILQDTRAVSADQVLNKVSGVNMVSLGNEQHQMSIRQPMTTKSLFLYLEDGLPIRTTGLFNHNALLEMNLAAAKSIEVIKGPSSSLYGSEAIGGVVNFITASPSTLPVLKLSAQGSNRGYRKTDLLGSFSSGNWGFLLSGYYAGKRNGFLEYSDFDKAVVTIRTDYRFSSSTTLSNKFTYVDYDSDMSGSIDSAMFATRTFKNQHTFTFRKVKTFRYNSTLLHNWSNSARSTASVLYRNNTIAQNPAYRVKDDYRRQGTSWVGNKELAHGEINSNTFQSLVFQAQHRQNLGWKNAVVIAGVNADLSPSGYTADYISIRKDTVQKKYVSFSKSDSTLSDYATRLNNYAAFANVEFSPVEKMKLVASLRFDHFIYQFNNHLQPSAFSGAADTLTRYWRFSPKIGFTYNFSKRTGLYANYSEGFVPPQVTELFTGVKVPELRPSSFFNYEVGGWVEVVPGKLSADISAYRLAGTNEIISVKLDDGSFQNENAGATLHRGIEVGLNGQPLRDLSLRFSGAYSKHEFTDFVEKGASYSGNEMNNAPNWLYNAEVWYKPSFVKSLRIGAEWQHVGRYFVDPSNAAIYGGYDVMHLRSGYQFKGFEVWLNVMNLAGSYYSTITSKSSFGYSYQLAEPRSFTLGISCDFAHLFKK